MTAQPKLTRLPELPPDEDDWHLAHARAAEADVRILERWLQETLVLTERFEGDETFQRALHGAAAHARERRNGLAEHARHLRAVIMDVHRAGLE